MQSVIRLRTVIDNAIAILGATCDEGQNSVGFKMAMLAAAYPRLFSAAQLKSVGEILNYSVRVLNAEGAHDFAPGRQCDATACMMAVLYRWPGLKAPLARHGEQIVECMREKCHYASTKAEADYYFRIDMGNVDPTPGSTSHLGAALRRLGLVELVEGGEREHCPRCMMQVTVTLGSVRECGRVLKLPKIP